MSNRFFEGKEHTKLYQQYRQGVPTQLVERVIEYLKEKFDGELNLAVDVGCGSGQNTFPYADHFKEVIGLDVSSNQIEVAREHNVKTNVSFEVSPAEKIDLPDGSVQLVVVMAAVHWFDIPKFFEEVERILCPGGVLALYCYGISDVELQYQRNPTKTEALTNAFKGIYEDSLKEYWSPAILLAHRNYRDITIPYQDFVRDETAIFLHQEKTLAYLLGELQTASFFQSFKRANTPEMVDRYLRDIERKLVEIIEEDLTEDEKKTPENIRFTYKYPYMLLMGRKSSN